MVRHLVKRTIGATIVCLLIAAVISFFVGLDLGVQELQNAFGNQNMATFLAKGTLSYLLTPYTLYATFGIMIPLLAWAAGGFIGGLISRSPLRGGVVTVLSVGIAFTGFIALSGAFSGLSLSESFAVLLNQAKGFKKDLLTAFFACLIPAIIGGAITESRDIKIIAPKKSE